MCGDPFPKQGNAFHSCPGGLSPSQTAIFGCRRKSLLRRRRKPKSSSRVRKESAPYIKAGKWHTFGDFDRIVDGKQIVPLHGHTPGHTGYEFSSRGKKILFWGDIMHAQRIQLPDPKVTVAVDVDPTAAAATRNRFLPTRASEDVLIAGPLMLFPRLGH